jgi:hypothetical protein
MKRTGTTLLAFFLAGIGLCMADEMNIPRKRITVLPARPAPVRVVEEIFVPEPVLLRPNCFDRFFPVLMRCAPQVVAPLTKAVEVAVDAPPRIRVVPYPTLFPYRYGN